MRAKKKKLLFYSTGLIKIIHCTFLFILFSLVHSHLIWLWSSSLSDRRCPSRPPKPLPSTNNADWSLRSPPLSLYYLIFPILCLSFFLHLKHQDPWSPVLGFDFVTVIDKTALLLWLSFDFVNGWWMGFIDGG